MTESTAAWKPVEGDLMTRWARDVSPANVLPEYPRPQFVRDRWQNLNGLWSYTVLPRHDSRKTHPVGSLLPDGEILVPFPIESALSGVKRALQPDERLWYQRTFTLPDDWQGERIRLHFGAVDWEAAVWVNDQKVGRHRGGFDPFAFDITPDVRFGAENKLVVSVWDPTETIGQERGKQVLEPRTIWYTAVSGIWQTVWLEPVPYTYIRNLRIMPSVKDSSLSLAVEIDGERAGTEVTAIASLDGQVVATISQAAGEELRLPIPNPVLWSPDNPRLYDLQLQLSRRRRVIDRVDSYFAMREFSLQQERRGVSRLCVNGDPLVFFGPLDQGYWPDGLYTAPTDDALRSDLELIKKLGCNMVRKHVKVEPARWYHHCDKLGLVVWQDMPNGGTAVGEASSFVALTLGLPRRDDLRHARHGREDKANRDSFMRELKAMIDALYNVPCIGMWVPFNEGWGQFDAASVANWIQRYDPSRLVDHASGWFDQGAGDVKSTHVYFTRLRKPWTGSKRAAVISEFGGYSLNVDGHLWRPDQAVGYKTFKDAESLTTAYLELLDRQLAPLIDRGVSGAVYTQLSDVEIEVNGFITYDREILKMDLERLQAAHFALLARGSSPRSDA